MAKNRNFWIEIRKFVPSVTVDTFGLENEALVVGYRHGIYIMRSVDRRHCSLMFAVRKISYLSERKGWVCEC